MQSLSFPSFLALALLLVQPGTMPRPAAGPVEILFPGRYQTKTVLHGRVRRIEVEVLRDGLRAKTLRGYYP